MTHFIVTNDFTLDPISYFESQFFIVKCAFFCVGLKRDSSQMSLLQMSRADCQSSYCKLLMSIVPIVHSSKCPKENEDICMPFNCRHACGPLCEVPDLWVLVMVG